MDALARCWTSLKGVLLGRRWGIAAMLFTWHSPSFSYPSPTPFLSDRQNRAIHTWTMGLFKPVTSMQPMRASVSLTLGTRIQPLPYPKPFCSNPVCRSRSKASRNNNEKCTSEGSSLETQRKQVMREAVRNAWQQGLTPVAYISLQPSSLKLQEVTAQCMHRRWIKSKVGAAAPVLSRCFLHLMGKTTTHWHPCSSFHVFSST